MQKEDEERRKTEWRRKLEQGSTANGSRKKYKEKLKIAKEDKTWSESEKKTFYVLQNSRIKCNRQ